MSGKPGKHIPTGHFYPTFALQCHSENAKNETVQIWSVEFEPDVIRNGETTGVFASCGGDSVCFINAKTGKVKNKFVDLQVGCFADQVLKVTISFFIEIWRKIC